MMKSRKPDPFARAYAVILAGGSGTRFWPLSRQAHPKQLLRLFGKATLLEQTIERFAPIIPPSRTFVLTSRAVRPQVLRLLPNIPPSQIIGEPAQRNTAPTIGLAASEVMRRDPAGVMIVLPSDQRIERVDEFRKTLAAACEWAEVEGRSVVVGIRPDRPETGYGYIRLGRRATRVGDQKVFTVERFTEKPALPVARRYVRSGRYLWNAGMFVWRASTVLGHLSRFEPEMAAELDRIAKAGGAANARALGRIFPHLKRISVDYALMERIPDVYAIPADIGWSDVGSWAVAYQLAKKDRDRNAAPPSMLAIDASGNLIVSENKTVAAVGVRDLVIVETADALLVCARDRSQDVGRAVEEMKRRGLARLL